MDDTLDILQKRHEAEMMLLDECIKALKLIASRCALVLAQHEHIKRLIELPDDQIQRGTS